ncbi:sensor domain-containing diguanylate cyclase [Vibrio rumoiensis]|uniref:diguanylate cyclase n=1 Tax=Vibrio rumoiensis 1S-45 TaxID=1188252 RepID=A0A1E5DZU4_9VIBR|nr:diguanylate cyclase [Vibrio rumoiensis]OEF23516.1 hypothetical protein A1QC_11600 [Vibrio rumoiensis 1S-45]
MAKLSTQGFISTKSVISAISALFFIMTIMMFFGIWYFLSTLDHQATAQIKKRVNLALTIESQHAQDILSEYTYWDESYERIFIDRDANWVSENTGDYLMDKFDLAFSVAIENDKDDAYLVKSENDSSLTFDQLMNNGLIKMMQHSRSLNTELQTTSGFIQVGENTYFVVGGPLVDEKLHTARSNSYLTVGLRVDSTFLKKLESNYQLFGLSQTQKPVDESLSMPIYSVLGKQITLLTWTPMVPSKNILIPITCIVLFITSITLLITRKILRVELNNRSAYEEQLYLEATTDPLTQISNRRYFMDMGNKEFNLSQRSKRAYSLLILDVDHFKSINDKYGHHAGDIFLKQFSEQCRLSLRDSDIFGRIGGEEFAIVLPDTDEEGAVEVAENIRLLMMNTPLIVNSNSIQVTVSIGVTTLQQQESFDELLQQADQVMYEAKREGRNRVKVFASQPSFI